MKSNSNYVEFEFNEESNKFNIKDKCLNRTLIRCVCGNDYYKNGKNYICLECRRVVYV